MKNKRKNILFSLFIILVLIVILIIKTDFVGNGLIKNKVVDFLEDLQNGDFESAFDNVAYFDESSDLPPKILYDNAKSIWIKRVKAQKEEGTYLKDYKDVKVWTDDGYPMATAKIILMENGTEKTYKVAFALFRFNEKWSVQNIYASSEQTEYEKAICGYITPSEIIQNKYPKIDISCNNTPIEWAKGDSNYTGKPYGLIGNTCFGDDKELEALEPTIVEPNAIIEFKAEDVEGLNKPRYTVMIEGDNNSLLYETNENIIRAPIEENVYTFNINVDWGNGDNEIWYVFKVKVEGREE